MPAPTITPLPTPPSRSTDPANFAIEADAFVAALPEFQTDANAQAAYLDALAISTTDYLDDLVIEVNADAALASSSASIAVGAANYKGDYSAITTYQIGQSVTSAGRQWVAKTVNLGITPVSGINWLLINDGDVLGPVAATNNSLAAFDGVTGKLIKSADLTSNNVLLGNGTGAPLTVAPASFGNVLTSNGTSWISAPAPASGVQYPQNIQVANYTLVLNDAGKQIFHPKSDKVVRTFTIPADASVAYPIGTVLLFTVEDGGFYVNVAITSDTLVFGSGTTGSVIVPPNNTLMCIKVTATKWMGNYLHQIGYQASQFIAVGHVSTPFIAAYPWSGSGFGAKFTDPATLPANAGNGVAFSPTGDAIAVVHTTTPFVSAYFWSGFGFGIKYANPATLPASTGKGVAFSPAGDAVAIAHTTTPFVSAYSWSAAGFSTRFSNPATLPTGDGTAVAFNPAGDVVAIAHTTTPFVSVYPWSSSTGFGTKFANPATLPTGNGTGVAFSPAGDAIAISHATTPFISAYPWSGSGFGTKFADPATLPANIANAVAFSPVGDAIAIAHFGAPRVSAYPWSGSGFGTKFADPATLPTGDGYGVAFNLSGDVIAIAHATSPFVSAYPWSGSGFGTKFSNPATLPAGLGLSVAFTLT